MDMKIKFMPMNVECDVDPSKSLLEIAKANGLKIKSICNGVPSCAECRVKIVAGDNSIPEPSKAELNLIGTSYFLDGRRLSCQVRCFGSVTVDLSEQLVKVDTQKKVRGFKQKDQKEISAVQDTMILNPEVQKAQQQAQSQNHQSQQQPHAPQGSGSQQSPPTQHHGNQQNKSKQHNQNHRQGQQQNQQRQGQKGQHPGQQQNHNKKGQGGQPQQQQPKQNKPQPPKS